MKKFLLWVAAILLSCSAFAQSNPVKWSISAQRADDSLYNIIIDARIASGWHLYDLGPYDGGPVATSFTFEPSENYRLVGKMRQSVAPTVKHDPVFNMQIGYYENFARFVQQVRPTYNCTIEAVVEWMCCNDQNCMPPADETLTVTIKDYTSPDKRLPDEPVRIKDMSDKFADALSAKARTPEPQSPDAPKASLVEPVAQVDTEGSVEMSVIEVAEPASSAEVAAAPAASEQRRGLWGAVIEAILWGFAALLTPCVFPMVPMTVSYFIKGSDSRRRGRFRASMYGLFIVLLYTLPIAAIILITRFVGGEAVTADIFNWLATHWLPNLLFFAVFMIFAASFFGAFEIVMPSSLVNKSDKAGERGGLGGLFFMALTLVLVSFSCTGPIVGSVLIKSTAGEFWEPIVTMLAFSIAFALPFTLLALFPSLLKNLPKSGGWLNSVKVVLGFIEVALGFKFLSTADQTYHWGLLDREVYLAIWIVVFTLLGLYLLGKLRFTHDSEVKSIGVTRLALAIVSLSFVVYMVPGMWGAPLKALSGYLPPITSQDFVLGAGTVPNTTPANTSDEKIKYADVLHLPFGLTGYFDMEQGMAAAQREGKPVFLDFTGHGCVNCREMEARVWSDERVQKILRDEYVVIALYSDDKMTLPEQEWLTTESGKVLKGLGKKNSYLVNKRYQVSAQPAYLLLDNNGELLTPVRGYNLDVEDYVKFLKDGVTAYGK